MTIIGGGEFKLRGFAVEGFERFAVEDEDG